MTSLSASVIWNEMRVSAPDGSMCSFMLSGRRSITLYTSTPEEKAVIPAAMHMAHTVMWVVTAASPYWRTVDIN